MSTINENYKHKNICKQWLKNQGLFAIDILSKVNFGQGASNVPVSAATFPPGTN